MTDVIIQIGLDVIRSYRRLAYTPWHALAEFVDNSTQSYRDNRAELDATYAKDGTRLTVNIFYNRDADTLIVKDNAMGMSLARLRHALHIGRPPAITTGRSQFGLGLKTAACWFGDKWTVRTKCLGESVGHEVEVDVESVASGKSTLPCPSFSAEKEEHFTEIRIEKLHMKLYGRRLGKTKDSLKSMYRVDIREGLLQLSWDAFPMPWQDTLTLLTKDDGTEARQAIDFEVGERRVAGWVGILAPGSSSRGNAGFALIRRGRVIRGWPDGWRPEAIFGPPPGRNDLVNQRVTGEIHLDAFDVTHTKDDILWHDEEEDQVQDGIKDQVSELLTLARRFRHKEKPKPPPVRKWSLDEVFEDAGFSESLSAAGRAVDSLVSRLAPPDVTQVAVESAARRAGPDQALATLALGSSTMRIVSSMGTDETDPYVAVSQVQQHEWVLAVSPVHPVCALVEGVDALRVHLQHAVADALVLWVTATASVSMDPFSRLVLKDAVLRTMADAAT